jgi:phosphoenolpyruvate-protein phosphotransferase (PTS system enzyme I)
MEEEKRFQGAPVSEGVAIGIPYFLNSFQEEAIPEFPISTGEVDGEIARYRRALFSSREDLQRLQKDLVNEGSTDAVTIIETHILMLEDPLITTHMEDSIRHMRQNTESVFRSVIHEYEKRFSHNQDHFFQQRLIDVLDVSKRILGHLHPSQSVPLNEIPDNSIIVAKELNPSYTAGIQASRVKAFVIQLGGGNSHTALIARAKGIPFVSSIDLQLLQEARGKWVIVDGITGEIIVNPLPKTIEKYRQLQKNLKTQYHLLEEEGRFPAKTRDDQDIFLYANVSDLSDLDSLHRQHLEGVGLYRSEYLILENPQMVYSEQEQLKAYIAILQKAQGLPVNIRVFDIGGDKHPDLFLEQEREMNPVLGCRGIRFLLRFKEIFRTQLRSLVRAAPYGNLRLILPLISDIEELRTSKAFIKSVKEELTREGYEFPDEIPIGCMIEVPSAVMISDFIAEECDFLAFGSNDLVQYALGIDRSNPLMSDLCYPAHPSAIRLMKMGVDSAKKAGKLISICGEIASNPHFIPLLIGLGITHLSCSPRFIPAIKQAIRRCSIVEAQALAAHVLTLATYSEISQCLQNAYRDFQK